MESAVRYELPDPAYEAHTWVYENEHHAASDPPIAWRPGLAAQPGPDGLPIGISVGGYAYFRWSPERDQWGRGEPDLSIDALALWRETWLPQVDALVRELWAFEPGAVPAGSWRSTLERLERESMRVFWGVHGRCLAPARQAANAFVERYAARLDEERREEALAMLQGFPNVAIERAAGLWDLSRAARADPQVRRAVEVGTLDGDGGEAASGFRAELDAFLARFGETTQNFATDLPTWAEDPSVPLAIVRGYLDLPDEDDPRAAARSHVERREALEAALRERAHSDEDAAALLALLPAAQVYLPILEDHNFYCDQRVEAASRARWLRIGEYLRGRGAIAAAEDIFFYRVSEAIETLEGGVPLGEAEIAARRARQAAWRATPPPSVLGRPLPAMEDAGAADGDASTLKGTASSAGTYRGRARVVMSLDAAETLEEGDVLVCPTTDPAWTPYFALLGAVVTDAGGALSHCAVVAREFGIPAVTGTRTATRAIRDGAVVRVDGSSGTVVVEA